ncbi:MAG: FAD-binding oxidoreductase [Candidatus Yanofskybacteria bacterium]|nr:FAD-binding oxidoreductase [Candidatus Yanofskybacteria bacterium]
MRVAVVGGGIFGVTAAIKLAGAGFSVDLFEKEKDILMAASGINQFRLHRGYHYPRSAETIRDCLRAEASFLKEYGGAVIADDHHHYCIAKEDSLIHHNDYVKICNGFGLGFVEARPALVNHDRIGVTIKGEEKRIDPDKLRKLCWRKLKTAGINVKLKEVATAAKMKGYDFRVIATYASLNELLPVKKRRDYQFELCEKPVVKLPREFNRQCLVVMDGPFMCVDPMGGTGNFLLGNVVHAIHRTNIGKKPEFDKKFGPLLNRGIIRNPPITNFKKFIESGSEFIPGLAKAKHVGSMFTFRTVMPNKEKTDERPTVVTKIDNKTVTIFSGKIGNCVEAADEILAKVMES